LLPPAACRACPEPAEGPLAWAAGQIFAPTQKFAQLQKTGKEQNISMKQILMEKYAKALIK